MSASKALSQPNTSSYVENCWYVAAWDYELTSGVPIPRQIIDQRIVLYRNGRGEIVALEDRCPHRFAPLSSGRVEGDDIRCMYHGLKFAPSGRCVEIPNQDFIPDRASVRAYPVAERDNWVWLWLGDPATADIDKIPRWVGLDHPDWRMDSGQMDIQANYELINDNLCDLTHLAYVHPTTLGRGAPAWANAPKVTRLPRGIRSQIWLQGSKFPGPGGNQIEVDQWNTYDFLAPGVFLLQNSTYPRGTAERLDLAPPPEDLEPLSAMRSGQAVTPISDQSSRYFFSNGPSAKSATPERIAAISKMAREAFEEDRLMEEGQQRIIALDPSRRMLIITTDVALNMMRKVMRQLAAGAEDAPAPAADGAVRSGAGSTA